MSGLYLLSRILDHFDTLLCCCSWSKGFQGYVSKVKIIYFFLMKLHAYPVWPLSLVNPSYSCFHILIVSQETWLCWIVYCWCCLGYTFRTTYCKPYFIGERFIFAIYLRDPLIHKNKTPWMCRKIHTYDLTKTKRREPITSLVFANLMS